MGISIYALLNVLKLKSPLVQLIQEMIITRNYI